ncbi:MAG: hypothetical protein AAGC45_09130 [Bacteroidota bacterium]
MKLIYKNDYGATFKIKNVPNTNCSLQLVVDCIGIFLTESDLSKLLHMVEQSNQPCYCEDCHGEKCKRLWCTSKYYEFGLALNEENIKGLVDLVKGTQFLLNMDETLKQYRLKPDRDD